MELWILDFIPKLKVIQGTVIWVWLPDLPIKFWDLELLLSIASKAGKPMAFNDFTIKYRKTKFARVQVEVDASEPLKLGISIRGLLGIFFGNL